MDEIWKDVDGYEGIYQVSNMGRVRSLDRVFETPHPRNPAYIQRRRKKGIILSQRKCKSGYLIVDLKCEGIREARMVHRIVAKAFLPNTNNYECVNHKDENKLNNNASNLEWCTPKYNANYGTAAKRMGKAHWKAILKLNRNGDVLCAYDSILEASKDTSITSQRIVGVLKGNRPTAGGYKWKYKEAE